MLVDRHYNRVDHYLQQDECDIAVLLMAWNHKQKSRKQLLDQMGHSEEIGIRWKFWIHAGIVAEEIKKSYFCLIEETVSFTDWAVWIARC